MNIVLAIFLFIHGFAHIVGFLVYWKIMKNKDVEYKTTIFPGEFNIGGAGIRVVGLFYLVTALAFGYLGFELLAGINIFWEYIWRVTIVSLVLCIIGWPDTKFGVVANVILILFLLVNDHFHWIV